MGSNDNGTVKVHVPKKLEDSAQSIANVTQTAINSVKPAARVVVIIAEDRTYYLKGATR